MIQHIFLSFYNLDSIWVRGNPPLTSYARFITDSSGFLCGYTRYLITFYISTVRRMTDYSVHKMQNRQRDPHLATLKIFGVWWWSLIRMVISTFEMLNTLHKMVCKGPFKMCTITSKHFMALFSCQKLRWFTNCLERGYDAILQMSIIEGIHQQCWMAQRLVFKPWQIQQ